MTKKKELLEQLAQQVVHGQLTLQQQEDILRKAELVNTLLSDNE